MKNINVLFFILLFTSCTSFENLTDDRHRPEDDEMYWNRTEEFWVTHHEPKDRPESSEDYYGNRTVLPPTYYNNYLDYNYYNRNNNYYPNYNYQQQTPPLQHNPPPPSISVPKPNVTHYKRNNEPQRGTGKPGVRR